MPTTTPDITVMVHYYEENSKHRDFLSSSKKDDYLGYIDKGIRSTDEFRDYLDYAGNPEKSSGVFNQYELLDSSSKKELREQLRKTKSVIWDLVISTEEKYGKRNLTSWKDGQRLLNDILPKFFSSIGMDKDNVIWYAGLHENTDNRHIHISFFEKEPSIYDKKRKGFRYRKGKIGIEKIRALKMNATAHFLEPIEGLRRMRDEAIKQTKATMNSTSIDDSMKLLIKDLYEEIPSSGHIYYDSDNMAPVREKIDRLSDLILSKDGIRQRYFRICSALASSDEEIIKSARFHHVESPDDWLREKKFRNDIHRRMGNTIISFIIDSRYKEIRNSKLKRHPKAKNKAHLKSVLSTMAKAFELNEKARMEAMSLFDEYEYLLAKAEHERLVEEGLIDENEEEM
jgi:hypothetical protein